MYWRHNVTDSVAYPSHAVNLDVYHLYIPFYSFTAQNLSQLRIPLWNPYQMCGTPYLAVLQGAVFYPPVMLFKVFSPARAYSIYWMAHAIMGGIFLMVLCRHLKLSWIASWAAAFVFMFCSNTVSKLFGPAFLANSVYLPLMFVFVLKIFETGRARWAVALAMAALASLLAGWIQALVYGLYALGVFVAAFVIRSLVNKGGGDALFIKRGMALLALSALLFLLLSSFQTLPTIEMGRMATRSFGEISEEMLTINNTAIYSGYRILHDTLNSRGGILPYYLYVGALPLFLGVLALGDRRLRFYTLFFWAMAACALILSMGPQTPFYKLWLCLPMTKMFRAPFRFLFLHATAICVLCAIGLDRFLVWFDSQKQFGGKKAAYAAAIAATASLALILAWPQQSLGSSQMLKLLAAASYWRFYISGLALLVVFLLSLPGGGRMKTRSLGAGCLALILLDLFVANHNRFYLPEINPSIYQEHSGAIDFLKSRQDTDSARVFTAADPLDFSYCIKMGQLTGLSMINDYENMNPGRYNRYCNYIFGKDDAKSEEFFWGWFNLDDELVHPELLNYMSTKYIWISRQYIEDNTKHAKANYRMLTESCITIFEDKDDLVFLNPKALPRAYIVGKSRIVPDGEETLKLLSSAAFSPKDEVILSDGMPQPEHADSKPASRRSNAIIDLLEPEEIRISTQLDGDGFLVLTDQYYPGWEATVDGAPVRIFRANYLFRSVPLTAGKHKVVFRYRPKSFRLGIALSVGSLLLFGSFITILSYRRKGRSKNTSLPEAT